jgi:predicted TIM-barrel fold metal-dependent hydrolase
MKRRDFLALGGAAAMLAGCKFSFEQGIFNKCGDPMSAIGSHPLVAAAWNGLRADQVWDCHVHLFGNGRSEKDIWVDPEFNDGVSPPSKVRRAFYRNAACAGADEATLDPQMVGRLTRVVDALPVGAKAMLLAFDFTYDESGKRREDQTTFSVSDAYAERVAKARPDRFEWLCSVHPYRDDAAQALAAAKANGARGVKWLVPTMGIDLAHAKCRAAYDELVRLDLPLLVHVGEEKAVLGAGREDLADPKGLRYPLERGVRVIAAHCASLGPGNFETFERLMAERAFEGRLVGDLSAVTQANRPGIFARILKHPEWEGRLLNGSDYPLPGILPLFSLNGFVSEGLLDPAAVKPLRELREVNTLAFDFVLKRSLSLKGKKLPSSAFETRPYFENKASLSPGAAPSGTGSSSRGPG